MTLPAYAHKVIGDVRSSRARTALVALSIALGVASVGMVAGARAMMERSLDRSRTEGAFASATLRTDPLPTRLLAAVRRVPGVADAQARHVVGVRVRTAAGWRDLTLHALPDFAARRIGRVQHERGEWPPRAGALLVERGSLSLLGLPLGDRIPVEMPAGRTARLRLAGTVHDLNVPATRTSGVPYGYVTVSELRRLGERGGPNELELRAAGSRHDVELVTARVRHALERAGIAVQSTVVPKPGVFWATDAVRSMELLLTVLSVVCLVMSTFLVANIVSSLVAQQVRQIGVMKAVGASSFETAALYLVTAALYGTAALVVAIPLAAGAALALVAYAAGLINLDAPGLMLPSHVLGLELAAGLAVPLAAALPPVFAGARVTVREAIARHGLEQGVGPRFAPRWGRIPAAVRLALTNTLHLRARLVLTLAALVVGGSVFIGVLCVRSSLLHTLHAAATYRAYDVDVTLAQPYPRSRLEAAVRGTPGLERAEAWAVEGAYRLRPDGSESETFSVVGVPAGTKLLHPSVLRGRWLRPGDGHAVVLNSDVVDDESDLRPGRAVTLDLHGRSSTWRVVGIVRRALQGPVLYANRRPLARAAREPGAARRLVLVTRLHGELAQQQVAQAVVARLASSGVRVDAARTSVSQRTVDERNFGIIITFLLVMAGLLAVVGGVGLMGTLSLNVLDRSREIGVLRAVGARDGDVARLVLVEGLLVAVLGWAVAAPLSVPVGALLSHAVGRLFLGAPLQYSYATGGLFLWLGLVLVLAAAACLVPARRAARLTVRDVLAYE
jgi:putative ABC transport system permease protein